MAKNNGTLSDFGFKDLVKYFGIKEENVHEYVAMRTLFHDTLQITPAFSDAVAYRKRAASMAKDRVESSYRLYSLYSDDFFKDNPCYQRDALTWAVICKSMEAGFEDLAPKNIDRKILRRAYIIIYEGHSIVTRENLSGYQHKPESFFMAHIEAFEELKGLEEFYSALSLQEKQEKTKEIIDTVDEYVRRDTKIGEELLERCRIAQAKLEEALRIHQKPSAQILAFSFPKR